MPPLRRPPLRSTDSGPLATAEERRLDRAGRGSDQNLLWCKWELAGEEGFEPSVS